MKDGKPRQPTRLGDVISSVLQSTGANERLRQASVIADWATLVGDQISRVTHPISVTQQGVLLVAVKTNAWMNELSLLEPELLRTINEKVGGSKIQKIRWQRWR